MKTLYWHRWRHNRGVVYLLHETPWHGREENRTCGELAIVRRTADPYTGKTFWIGQNTVDGHYAHGGTPAKARQLVENYLDRKCIDLFNDDVNFTPC